MTSGDAYLRNKKQAAKFLNISDASLERLMRSGLAYVKIGGLVRFRPEDLNEFIDSRRRVAQGSGGVAA